MCGIYGRLSRAPISIEEVLRSRDRLDHRGPDDAGLWMTTDKQAALGHRRLSILDLTPSGHQPMASACGRFLIVFNGEIYNYLELREELVKLGVSFHSRSDTEVLLAAFREWGGKCLNRLNGMFAFAILDSAASSLFFARDRAGKKPFYYRKDRDGFAFASELKALGKAPLSLRALNYYLSLGYVPGDLCIAEGVNKLPPAHAGTFDLVSGTLKTWPYWALPANEPTARTTVENLVDEADSLFRDSVRIRMRSDVPVGVLLSGGLDSSLVVAAAAQVTTQPVKTFTISFPGTPLDESRHASVVARHFGTQHHVLELPRPSLDTLEEMATLIDEPIADSSLIPTYLVSKLTVGHVKVALGGDGGDELFGGYSDYHTALKDDSRLGWIPAPVLSRVARLAGGLPAGVKGRNRLFALQGGPHQSMIWGSPYFDWALRKRVFTEDALQELGPALDEPERWLLSLFNAGRDPVDAMTRTHFGSILPDDFLVKVDRASMAVSLEMRSPFLDHRLVEFAFGRVPSRWKVAQGQTRILERKIAERWLPTHLDLNRKQGFSIPLDSWLRSSRCRELEELRHCLPDAISGSVVDDLIRGEMRGRANGSRIFSLIMLALARRNTELRA